MLGMRKYSRAYMSACRARVDADRDMVLPRIFEVLHGFRQQLNRKIVDAVEAHVLESLEDGAFSGAGEPGEDDELA